MKKIIMIMVFAIASGSLYAATSDEQRLTALEAQFKEVLNMINQQRKKVHQMTQSKQPFKPITMPKLEAKSTEERLLRLEKAYNKYLTYLKHLGEAANKGATQTFINEVQNEPSPLNEGQEQGVEETEE